jgi:steroid 5-alpha reductase family enzyme
MSALTAVITTSAVISFLAWIRSLYTGDTSQVDRLWSLLPEIYVWIFAGYAHFNNLTLDVMAFITTLWGARLTFNFARKGGYNGEEDYRWEVLRKSMAKWQFQLFNIFFIIIYQNFLLVMITLPAYFVYLNPKHHSTWLFVLALVFIAALAGETIADQQQWNFYKSRKAGNTSKNFNDSGLFAISRHPNFFFEQSQWWIFYLIGATATGIYFNWTILGAFLLTTLFLGSTNFTESISKSKYPEYADYQKRVPALLPWIGKKK